MPTSSLLPTPAHGTERTDPVVTVDRLVKEYDGVRVVDGVDLHVERGEIFGILGANGAGKTTTVECLQGLRRPDAGTIRVLGLDPIEAGATLRQLVGSQLQDAALPDRLRVGEAVALFDRHGRTDPSEHLEPWGLAGQRRTNFADLSGGQRQRLFIVLALLNDPQVVFLDELTQGLDPAARRDVWRAIRRVRDGGATVVLVSHFAEEVEVLCDRVAVMSGGQVIDTATPRELVDRHAAATTITCTPPTGYDLERIGRLVEVRRVDHDGARITVHGATAMIAPVCAALLDGSGVGPADLRVTHPTLDDALVELIGGHR